MSQQEQEDSGFLSKHRKRALENQQKNGGGLGSFLESKLDGEEQEPSDGIQYGTFEKTSNYAPSVFFHSSEDMGELDDESVHFCITSPPYNTGWSYGSYDDAQDYATEYLPMLARVFKEVHRVLVPGARFVVNVPSLLRSGAEGGFPIAADITRMLIGGDGVHLTTDPELMWGDNPPKPNDDEWYEEKMPEDRPGWAINTLREETGFVMREQIAWFKDFNTDGLAPNGSFPRPWGILLNNMHEVCIVFQKPGTRDFSDMDEDLIERSKINKRDSDMCDDVWFINPDSWSPKHTEEDIPVFPEKLVRRAIQLWTYEEDTVLDPFAGRFTTGKVSKDLRRYGVGYELREDLREDIERFANVYETGLYQFTE